MTENIASQTNSPIDVVITWVDGNDPVLAGKRRQYIGNASNMENHPGAITTRFTSNNEIKYCILSIFKFAPFIRNVYIVTDGQQPDIFDDIKTYFPERLSSIRIVDHKEIFSGFEQYLPTFNSTSIESLIWRINGLSENFVYFNDDIFLIRDVKPEEWVKNGKPTLIGKWKVFPFNKLFNQQFRLLINRKVLGKKNYHPKLSFYLRQWQAAKILGYSFNYFFHCHTPHALNRNTLERFYAENAHILEKNLKYRFRDEKQFISISLANHLEIKNGNKQYAELNHGYFHPYYSAKRIAKKITRCDSNTAIKSICVQSYDMLKPEVQNKIMGWLGNILQIKE